MEELLKQRGEVIEKILDLASYPEYHESLNNAIEKIDDLILKLNQNERE